MLSVGTGGRGRPLLVLHFLLFQPIFLNAGRTIPISLNKKT